MSMHAVSVSIAQSQLYHSLSVSEKNPFRVTEQCTPPFCCAKRRARAVANAGNGIFFGEMRLCLSLDGGQNNWSNSS
eukprot:2360344-Rhodomonas_salina.2